MPLMLSTARGLPIDAVVCICVREGVPRAPPNSRTSAGVLPSAQSLPSSPAWDIQEGRELRFSMAPRVWHDAWSWPPLGIGGPGIMLSGLVVLGVVL